MQVHTFIAESAADAVAQIRAQLGPQAVVVNVRPLPAEGISRLWQKRKIEVLAYLPEESTPSSPAPTDALAELRQELVAIRQKVEGKAPLEAPVTGVTSAEQVLRELRREEAPAAAPEMTSGVWRIGSFLETSGLLPMHAHRVLESLRSRHGDAVPVSLGRELDLAGEYLRDCWNRNKPLQGLERGAHVLIGPPGAGKTVCLCKWLAQSILVDNRPASVWRLDGRTANTAEALSVYGEILGVTVERSVPAERPADPDELVFIDLPGVDWNDPAALSQLKQQLEELPRARVHLVLNAAYESPVFLAQARAFASLPVADVIFTHLDEELRWGKVWNLVLGTNFSISYLSAGQNIPGAWIPASPEQVFSRQFPRK